MEVRGRVNARHASIIEVTPRRREREHGAQACPQDRDPFYVGVVRRLDLRADTRDDMSGSLFYTPGGTGHRPHTLTDKFARRTNAGTRNYAISCLSGVWGVTTISR